MNQPDERPLSFNQASYLVLEWLAHLRARHQPAVPLRMAIQLEGALQIDAVEDALNETVRRHEVLRTSFLDPRRLSAAQEAALTAGLRRGIADAGVFTQRVWSSARVRLAVETLPGAEREDAGAEVRARMLQEAERPFDYAAPPLMQATLFRTGPDQHVLLVSLHHLVADSWSMGVIRYELQALYNRRVTGRSLELPGPAMQYADFARQQRRQFREIPAALAAYWKEQWATYGNAQIKPADLRAAHLQTADPRVTPLSPQDAGHQSVTLDEGIVSSIRALAKRTRATTYMIGLTAMAIVFHAYTRRTVLAWWGYCSNRRSSEVEGLVGWFAHGRVFGISLTPDETATALIARVRDRVYDMYEHEEAPVQVLGNILRDQHIAPPDAFDEHFVSYDFFTEDTSEVVTLADGVIIRPVPHGWVMTGNWPSLGIWTVESRSALTLRCRYSSTRCAPSAIAGFLDDFAAIFAALARTPEASVSQLAAGIAGR